MFGGGLGGLWMAFIGWFLLNAAAASYGQAETVDRLRGLIVADVMQRDCARLESEASIQTVVDDLLRTGRRCFVVVEGASVVGLLTPHEIKEVPRDLWRERSVAEVMRPLGRLHVVRPDSTVADALEAMVRGDVHQLPVVSERLEGVISRGDVVRVLKTRQELGV